MHPRLTVHELPQQLFGKQLHVERGAGVHGRRLHSVSRWVLLAAAVGPQRRRRERVQRGLCSRESAQVNRRRYHSGPTAYASIVRVPNWSALAGHRHVQSVPRQQHRL